jgi:hypothetical protein
MSSRLQANYIISIMMVVARINVIAMTLLQQLALAKVNKKLQSSPCQ